MDYLKILIKLSVVGLIFSGCQSVPLEKIDESVVRFSATGCGPYGDEAKVALVEYLRRENQIKGSRSEFIIHLGDIVSLKRHLNPYPNPKELPETAYSEMRALLLENNHIPTYIVPGDNEWNDQADPDRAWRYWEKHLLGLDVMFEKPWETFRQKVRSENFAFVQKGVLFIGLNMPGGKVHDKAEWDKGLSENAEWVRKNFLLEDVYSAVIFFQVDPVNKKKREDLADFFRPFKLLAEAFSKPVLLLHADGHKWVVDKEFLAENVLRIQTDNISAQFPLIQVTVSKQAVNTFSFNRRLDWVLSDKEK